MKVNEEKRTNAKIMPYSLQNDGKNNNHWVSIINWISVKTIRSCFLVREYGLHVKIWANSNWVARETNMSLFYNFKVIIIYRDFHIFFWSRAKMISL